ncbi:MAG TPA: Fe-S cluster assembly protein SufD [Vicinamibacterales bacterium]|nr:Fe-S cluster assembly protein SufD [Vicinamibacterales bacterium]
MTQVAERHEALASAFEAFRSQPASGAGTLRELRSDAFARFLDRGWPTTRDEEWRHTSIAPIASATFGPTTGPEPSRQALEPFLFDGDIRHQMVVVNGRLSAALSTVDALPAGVTVRSLAAALAAGAPGALAAAMRPNTGTTPLVDLNTAFFEEGVLVEIAAKAIVADPIHVLFVTSVDRPAMVPTRLAVVAGAESQATIVETYTGVGAGGSFTNAVTHVAVGAGGHVDHVKLQREPADAFHLSSTFVRLERAAVFASRAITLGGRIGRNDITATLAGEGAECTLNGVYVADGDTLVDTHTTIDHAEPHCPSHEVYKGILGGKARAVFNGKIIVRPQAQKTDAKQTNKALLLSDDAQINTKPQLEIFADDVKCTHGAAIGQLDEDAMFYLRARGVAVKDARNMLIHAFAGEVLDGIAVDAVRDRALRLIDDKLHLT